MLSDAGLNQFREDRQTTESLQAKQQWRDVPYHAMAVVVEACSECGMVRDRERLVRCPWCEDTYCCQDETCGAQHRASLHPAVAYWTW